ncbi:hypothetical protein J4727_00435 [Providencia rettgeri]|uniref:Uncharacterized protein n=1 Tax=Providencia rettgeri TaxID=587 RepID=A0A939SIU3_PRORE|nr:hypothetical protein [Providencia rettgeri]
MKRQEVHSIGRLHQKLLKSASFIKDPDTFFYCVKLASDELLFGENIKPTHASVYVKNETSWVSFEPKTGTNVEITGEKLNQLS